MNSDLTSPMVLNLELTSLVDLNSDLTPPIVLSLELASPVVLSSELPSLVGVYELPPLLVQKALLAPHVEKPGSSLSGTKDLLLEQQWTFIHEALDEHDNLEGYDLLGERKLNIPKSNLFPSLAHRLSFCCCHRHKAGCQ